MYKGTPSEETAKANENKKESRRLSTLAKPTSFGKEKGETKSASPLYFVFGSAKMSKPEGKEILSRNLSSLSEGVRGYVERERGKIENKKTNEESR